MTSETLTCPYCNASLAPPTDVLAGQRIVCPRCGDAFPLRPTDAILSQGPTLSATGMTNKPATMASGTPPNPAISLASRRSNGLIAGLVIGLMLLMAGGGLAFMLMTQAQRRAQDTSRPPRRPGKQRGVPEPSGLPVVVSIPPDKLEALGYLPSDVNFLVAARIPELLANPVGAQLLRESFKIGGAEHRLSELPEAIGFARDDIDHLVLGVRVEKDILPPYYLVIRTAQPYDAEQLRQRLQGKRVASASKKKMFAFRPPRLNLTMNIWCADEHTVVWALFGDQLEALPNRPVADLQQFSQELRTVLKERREAVTPLWLAGHSSDWSKTFAATFLTQMKKKDWDKLSPMRTFGVWFVPETSLAIRGVFACKDEAGAHGLDEYVHSLRRADANLKTAQDGPWLTVQFQAGPDFLARLMKH